MQTQSKVCIRGMCTNIALSYLFTGHSDGSISIFELGRPRAERFTKQISTF